jgi:hypothetical protein
MGRYDNLHGDEDELETEYLKIQELREQENHFVELNEMVIEDR